MFDYGRLVFLDNQKTGSTYVSDFLNDCCALAHVRSHKHAPVREEYRPDSVYFSTVRHPADLYVSLYQYGADRKGGTFRRIRRIRRLDLYESLPKWLDFVLDEAHAELFDPGFAQVAQLGMGIMSFRTLRITLRNPQRTMAAARSHNELITTWRKHTIAKHIFRQEELNSCLLRFATETVPDFFHQEKVRAFLDTSGRVNASTARVGGSVPNEQLQRILARERFLIEEFYSG